MKQYRHHKLKIGLCVFEYNIKISIGDEEWAYRQLYGDMYDLVEHYKQRRDYDKSR